MENLIMSPPKPDPGDELAPALTSGEKAHAALVARLAQLYRKPVKPPKSLQPTPEAAKTRLARLRRKRMLVQKSKGLPTSGTDSASRSAGL
jgi:hypothetical protein